MAGPMTHAAAHLDARVERDRRAAMPPALHLVPQSDAGRGRAGASAPHSCLGHAARVAVQRQRGPACGRTWS